MQDHPDRTNEPSSPVRRQHMPPEWAVHEATYLSWPVQDSMIHPEDFDSVREAYAQTAQAISRFEKTAILADPSAGDAEEVLKRFPAGVQVLDIPHDDAWLRDNGPTFVQVPREDGSWTLAGLDWRFNAWGGKYPEWQKDDRVAALLLDRLDLPVQRHDIVLEGGSIHVNGDGLLLTTDECLLNPNRNPGRSRGDLESVLKPALGVDAVIWLPHGVAGDETDGHVDNVACFISENTILIQTASNPAHPDFSRSRANLAYLEDWQSRTGRSLNIIELPAPPPRAYQDTPLALSYINFYLVNGGLILPVFGLEGDAELREADLTALRIIRRAFPDREIVEINGMPLIREGGNVHCITQQRPQTL